MWMVIFAIAAGAYTAMGLHFFSVLLSQMKRHLMRILLLPLFIVLFVGGPVIGSTVMAAFSIGETTRPVHGNSVFFTLLLWIGIVGLYIFFGLDGLKRRLGVSLQENRRPPSHFTAETTPISNDIYKLGYVPGLNGLRGFAILLVMLCHGSGYLRGGFVGVDIFFVLSGFLITTLLVKEFDRSNFISLRKFYMRRALRLIPEADPIL